MKERARKALIFGGIAVVLTIAAALALTIASGAGQKERGTMLALAREYIDRGDYDRALNLLDTLIIKNPADADARALQDEALARKMSAKSLADDATRGGSNDTGALAQSLGELGKSLERTVTSVAQGATSKAAADQAAANTKASAAARPRPRRMLRARPRKMPG